MKKSVDIYNEILKSGKLEMSPVFKLHFSKIKEIDSFFPPSDSFVLIVNTDKLRYDFVSKNFEYVLGYKVDKMLTDGPNFWLSLIHPEDLRIWLKVIDDVMEFTLKNVPVEKRMKLVYTYNFRVRDINGQYINLIAHLTPLALDGKGKPVVGISHYSVVSIKKKRPIIGSLKILNDNNVYETLYYKNYTSSNLTDSLTKRERDIIRLLAVSMTSKEIAEKLFISSHTVDQHRRNILKKLNFKSSGEIIQYCKNNPLF